VNETLEHRARFEELTIEFHFVDCEKFTQNLPIDNADAAQDVMEWFRDPKAGPVWTWRNPHSSKIQMIPRTKITFIQINGYIDLEQSESKWYQRLLDKCRTFWLFNFKL